MSAPAFGEDAAGDFCGIFAPLWPLLAVWTMPLSPALILGLKKAFSGCDYGELKPATLCCGIRWVTPACLDAT